MTNQNSTETTEVEHIAGTEERDQEILGAYIEHCPDDPIWPDGCQTIEVVTAHVPEVITLTYGQILEHLAAGYVLALQNGVVEALRARFEKDQRYIGYKLDLSPDYDDSAIVSLERKGTVH